MKSIFSRIKKKAVLKFLLKKGYPYCTGIVAINELEQDMSEVKDISLLKKIVLYRKGYFSERIRCYKINEENRLDKYMPEIKYYKIHPVNGIFSKWIDDKLTIRYIFNQYSQFFPQYYYQIFPGKVTKLIDCPQEYAPDIHGVIKLLEDKGMLAAKLFSGSRADGFCKFVYSEGIYFVNDKEISAQDLIKKIDGLDDYLITEYLMPYEGFNKIFPTISTSIRVIVINDENRPRIVASCIIFRIKKNVFSEKTYQNAIYCGVDINDGTMFGPCRYDTDKNIVYMPVHSDTGEEIKGRIKNWDVMKETLIRLSLDFPQLCYMGFDIIFTEDSFKIIEINSLPGLWHTQCFYPMLKDERNREFFKKHFEARNMKL